MELSYLCILTLMFHAVPLHQKFVLGVFVLNVEV